MENIIYNIKMNYGGEEIYIYSPFITGVYYDTFGEILIIKGYLNFKEIISYRKTLNLVNWALKTDKFSEEKVTYIDVEIRNIEEEVRSINIKNAKVLRYIETGNIYSNFHSFEIVIQNKFVNLNTNYTFEKICDSYRHIIFKTSNDNLKLLESKQEHKEVFKDFITNYKVIEFGISEYSGFIKLNFGEIQDLYSEGTEIFFEKVGKILSMSLETAEKKNKQ